MIAQLTTNERQTALVLLTVLAVVGLTMAAVAGMTFSARTAASS